jgi:translation elongation factor EF-Tu-like GTPase
MMTGTSKVRVSLFAPDRGGRHSPIFPGYRPQLIPAGSNQRLSAEFVDGFELLAPGQSGAANIRLLDDWPDGLKAGDRFTIWEEATPDPDEIALGLEFTSLGAVGEVEVL